MKLRVFGTAAALAATVGIAAGPARAQSVIKSPDDHPHYSVEAEPHALFGYDPGFGSGSGFGLGGRVSFPIVDPGFVKNINNTVAIGTGLDIFFIDGCYYRNRLGSYCNETAFLIPVVMQWNFYVAPHWSVFGEPGLAIRHRAFNACPDPGCNPSENLFLPFVFYAGGRYHFNENVALTMRLGFDNLGAGYFSIGVSFFP